MFSLRRISCCLSPFVTRIFRFHGFSCRLSLLATRFSRFLGFSCRLSLFATRIFRFHGFSCRLSLLATRISHICRFYCRKTHIAPLQSTHRQYPLTTACLNKIHTLTTSKKRSPLTPHVSGDLFIYLIIHLHLHTLADVLLQLLDKSHSLLAC